MVSHGKFRQIITDLSRAPVLSFGFKFNRLVELVALRHIPPVRARVGGGVENVSSVSPACRKMRLIGAVCRNHRIKRFVPCRCLDGHVKETYEMSMALEARPWVQLLLLQSACTSMCRHMYD